MKPSLLPKELAEAVGVSVSSLKRWANEGLLTVGKTAGGHRRIAIGEAVRFIRAQKLAVLRPDALGVAPGGGGEDDLLHAALVAGDAARARGVLAGWYLAGRSLAELSDGPIRSAMERIGRLYQEDPSGVFVEHRATDACLAAVRYVAAMMPEAGAGAPLAVGGAAEHDPYALPSLLASLVLAEVGFAVENLGPITPLSAMERASEAGRAKVVWLSCSVQDAALEAELAGALSRRRESGAHWVVGGRGIGSWATQMRGLTHARDMRELATFARGLLAGRE